MGLPGLESFSGDPDADSILLNNISLKANFGFQSMTNGGYYMLSTGGLVQLEQTEINVDAPAPFFVYLRINNPSEYYFSVIPGMVNNVEPTLDGQPLSDDPPPKMALALTGKTYIYLKCAGSTGSFPGGVTIESGTTMPTDTDTFGYVLLATFTASNKAVIQYVSGSLWGDRLKVGSYTARYYYSRV